MVFDLLAEHLGPSRRVAVAPRRATKPAKKRR
jgi:hypothetical protein